LAADKLYKAKLQVKAFLNWKLAVKVRQGVQKISQIQKHFGDTGLKEAWSRLKTGLSSKYYRRSLAKRVFEGLFSEVLEGKIARRFRTQLIFRRWSASVPSKQYRPPQPIKKSTSSLKKRPVVHRKNKVPEFQARLEAKYRRRALKSVFVLLIENVIQKKRFHASAAERLEDRSQVRRVSLAFHKLIAYMCLSRQKRRKAALAEAHYQRRSRLVLLSSVMKSWHSRTQTKLKLLKLCEYCQSARAAMQIAKVFRQWRQAMPKSSRLNSLGSLSKGSESGKWSGSLKSSARYVPRFDDEVGDWLETVRREERRRREEIERELSSLQSSLRASALNS
jgi:hypothetical protein